MGIAFGSGLNLITPFFVGVGIALSIRGSGAHLNPVTTGLICFLPGAYRGHNGLYLLAQLLPATVLGAVARRIIYQRGGELLGQMRITAQDLPTLLLHEAIATFLLMSLIAVLVLTHRGTWGIWALPILIVLLQLVNFGDANMNSAVSLFLGIEGLLDWGQVLGHFIGQLVGLCLTVFWVKLWLARKRPASTN